MYMNVFTLCPGILWPPLSTIVTLLLAWASYFVCISNTCCNTFLYCLVLLMWIHSKLRGLLLLLLFINASFYTNDVVLLLYHVLREYISENVNQRLMRTHFLNVRSQVRIRGVCAGDFNYVYVFKFGILNQTNWWSDGRWLDVVSSNGLRSSRRKKPAKTMAK